MFRFGIRVHPFPTLFFWLRGNIRGGWLSRLHPVTARFRWRGLLRCSLSFNRCACRRVLRGCCRAARFLRGILRTQNFQLFLVFRFLGHQCCDFLADLANRLFSHSALDVHVIGLLCQYGFLDANLAFQLVNSRLNVQDLRLLFYFPGDNGSVVGYIVGKRHSWFLS